MTDQDDTCSEGCPDRGLRLSRRGLLGAGVAGAVAATFGSTHLQTAYGATRSAPSTLVLLSLRGAADGLSLVVPHAEPVYYAARRVTAVPRESLLARDAMFGLHPGLAALQPLWAAGRLAAVHAVGLPAPNRSHFAAMEALEDADPGSAARVGWLNRLVGRDSYTNPLQAIQYGGTVPSTQLVGPAAVTSVASPDQMVLAGADRWDTQKRRPRSLRTLWGNHPGVLGAGGRAALTAVSDYSRVRTSSTTPANGAVYPKGDLGKALSYAARTIRADIGAEVITVDFGGWDMHTGLGTLEWGSMRNLTRELAGAMAAFFADLGGWGQRVTLVTVSEFGRRVQENSGSGTDHGWGTVMLLAGAGVKGGRVYAEWPGLVNSLDADLKVTTDYRSVLAEVIAARFGASVAQVFPGFTPAPVGVMARP